MYIVFTIDRRNPSKPRLPSPDGTSWGGSPYSKRLRIQDLHPTGPPRGERIGKNKLNDTISRLGTSPASEWLLFTRGGEPRCKSSWSWGPCLHGFIRILTSAQLPGYTVLYGPVDQRAHVTPRNGSYLGRGRTAVWTDEWWWWGGVVWFSFFLPVYKQVACLVRRLG